MERCCRSVRFMLRCVSQQVKDILEGLVSQIILIYSRHKHSCFLYLGSILVDEYATDLACIQGLLEMLQTFIGPTFELLREDNGLRNHPDTVDDFFRLCARFMQRAPSQFLQCTAMAHIFQCGLLACSLDHKEANTSVMKFFYDLVSSARNSKKQPDYEERSKLVQQILEEFGQQLIGNLVHASVFCLHSYMLAEVGDVILELLELDREMIGKWLANAVESLPKDGNGVITVSPQQLNEFHIAVCR